MDILIPGVKQQFSFKGCAHQRDSLENRKPRVFLVAELEQAYYVQEFPLFDGRGHEYLVNFGPKRGTRGKCSHFTGLSIRAILPLFL